MNEKKLVAVVDAAQQAAAEGRKWHFHILSPTCCFNSKGDHYALVVEISPGSSQGSLTQEPDQNTLPREQTTLIAYSTERPAEQGKRLVALLHGEKILEGTGSPERAQNEAASTILVRARNLSARRIPWHHHMLFPDCTLNPNPGMWNLLFEDPETGEQLNALYHDEPVHDLREVEALFNAQQK
jgi:hypothetical protein